MKDIEIILKKEQVNTFDIKKNGVQCFNNNEELLLRNDPFCTTPAYIYQSDDNLVIFSDWDDLLIRKDIKLIVDPVGIWETYLYGTTLYQRTLFKNVKVMPGASELCVKKSTGEFIINKYWDYNILVNNEIDSMDKAVKGFIAHLNRIFSTLEKDKKYLLGLSGGLDSRITAAYLSKYISNDNISLFTYGFNKKILEFQYAKIIASNLGLEPPLFHKLTTDSYLTARESLPYLSGGQLSVNHCHIVDFLKSNPCFKNHIQISTYYSDAIFGWDCLEEKKQNETIENFNSSALQGEVYLSNDVKKIIEEDFRKIFDKYEYNSNYSSFSEYKYLTERNQKFHFNLANVQNRTINTKLVFADIELLKYYLSIPLKFRAQKKIVEEILEHEFPEISSNAIDNVSSRAFRGNSIKFSTRSIIKSKFDWYSFKLINRINFLLRILFNGKIQLFNKFQTEEQERVYIRKFLVIQKNAVTFLKTKGYIEKAQFIYLSKNPYHGGEISRKFSLIGIYDFFKSEKCNRAIIND